MVTLVKEKSEVFFSVIIPTWNRKKELIRALKSVLNQTFHDWELLIVEDGSESQNEIITTISNINDKRIHTIALKEHHNAAYARNRGIDEAKGEWIAFLDSDDYFAPDKLEIVHNFIISNAINSDSVIYSQFLKVLKNNQEVAPSRGINNNESIGDYLFCNGGMIGTPGIVMDRAFAAKIKFNPNYVKHQDYDLLLRAEANNAKFIFIDKVLWTREYRMSNDHVGSTRLSDFSCFWFNIHKQYLSNSARSGFLYMHVFDPMMNTDKAKILVDIKKIIKYKNIPKGYFHLLLSTTLPYIIYKAIKRIAAH